MEKFVCCICGVVHEGWGNNPDGAVWKDNGEIKVPTFNENDRCCDACNSLFVIPGRLYLVGRRAMGNGTN